MLVLLVQPLVAMLKVKLGAFGWAEAVRRDAKESQWRGGAAAAAAELDAYLERMGVRWVHVNFQPKLMLRVCCHLPLSGSCSSRSNSVERLSHVRVDMAAQHRLWT